MSDAAAMLEKPFARVAVSPVLLDGVVDGLFGEVVLEFEGDDRQAVDEQGDVQRPLRLVAAVAKLPGDGKAVSLEAFSGLLVARRGRSVEQVQVVRGRA